MLSHISGGLDIVTHLPHRKISTRECVSSPCPAAKVARLDGAGINGIPVKYQHFLVV